MIRLFYQIALKQFGHINVPISRSSTLLPACVVTAISYIYSPQTIPDLTFSTHHSRNSIMSLKPDDTLGEAVGGNTSSPHAMDNASTESSLHQIKSAGVPEAEFKPSKRLYVAFGTLAVITLMVALDGTSLSVALPVSLL